MRKSIVAVVATFLVSACGSGSDLNTGVLVQAAAGPAPGGADIQYFGMLLFVGDDIPDPAVCPTVTEFDATIGPPHVVNGVLNGAIPVDYTEAMLADVNNSAFWDDRQISDDAVFPMVPVGSTVMLCTYPLNGTQQMLTECTPGTATDDAVLGVLELVGHSDCTTPQLGAVVAGASGNNSPTLEVISSSITACADNADWAIIEVQVTDPEGDDVELTVAQNPVVPLYTHSPAAMVTLTSGGTQIVGVRGPFAADINLEISLADVRGAVADGPFTTTMHLVTCP